MAPGPETIVVRVAFSPRAAAVDEVTLALPAGATVADAIAASGLAQRHPTVDLDALGAGVWARAKGRDEPLRDGDRVELYRPLQVDPKEARRLRYKAHLAKYPPKGSAR